MAIDREAALQRVEGDEVLLADLAKLFCEESPRMLSAIQEAIARKNAEALERAAHSLKGSVATFAAPRAFDLALKLERLGRANDFDNAESHIRLTCLRSRARQSCSRINARRNTRKAPK